MYNLIQAIVFSLFTPTEVLEIDPQICERNIAPRKVHSAATKWRNIVELIKLAEFT